MRRTAWIALGGLALSLAATGPAGAASDTKGPACANIVSGDWAYQDSAVNPNLSYPTFFQETDLAKPSCRSVTYVLHLTDADGNAIPGGVFVDANGTPIGSGPTFSIQGDGTSTALFYNWQYQGDPSATPQNLFFYVTSQLHRHVADRANDSGLVDVALDGPISGHQFG